MGMPEAAASQFVERAAVVCATCGTAFPKGMLTRCPKDADKLDRAEKQSFHPLIGRLLTGRYRVLYELGRGSMATVFGAEHTAIGRSVALKVLDPARSRGPDVVPRFQREARASSRIESPHVVTLLDFGEAEDGLLYLAMELVEGPTLSAEIRERGALPWAEAVRIARDVALALAAAHAAGVVHRDLKPDNVLLAGSKRVVKVLDFGIAKIMQPDDDASAHAARAKLTAVGVLVGTPGYMSPEAIAHETVGPSSDLYALGATLFELLAGRPPFVEPARAALLAHHLATPAPRLADVAPDRELPADLDALVTSLLAKSPAERPADALTVARLLSSVLGQPLPNVIPRSVPPEGEPAASARPTVRMDVDDLPEEVRPTLRLHSEALESALAARLAAEELVPTVAPRQKTFGVAAIVMIAIGAPAVLLLSAALVWTLTAPREPASTRTIVPRVTPTAPALIDPSAAVAHEVATTPADRVSADAGVVAARPPTPRDTSSVVRPPAGGARGPIKRGPGPGRPPGRLDIVRDYP